MGRAHIEWEYRHLGLGELSPGRRQRSPLFTRFFGQRPVSLWRKITMRMTTETLDID
jgi:hypothetical protein